MKNKIRFHVAVCVVAVAGVFASTASAWSYPPTGYPWCYSGNVNTVARYTVNGVSQGVFKCVSSPYGYWWTRLGD